MTCGLGIIEAKTVLLAADSAAASLKNPEIYNLKTAKVFRVGSYGIVYTTSYRLGQILRYETELPEPPEQDLERFMDFNRSISQSQCLSEFAQTGSGDASGGSRTEIQRHFVRRIMIQCFSDSFTRSHFCSQLLSSFH